MSKSEYHDYAMRRKSDARIGREALGGFVAERLYLHKGRHGYRRINREPRRDGIVVSGKRALAVMREPGPQAKGGDQEAQMREGGRDGRPAREPRGQGVRRRSPQQAMGGRHHLHRNGRGWLHFATVIDAFHRKVAGWSMSGRMTEKLVADALEQAVGRESPPDGFSLVFHDDQGSNTLPGRSGAASSPMESPNPCRGRATHGTTRSRNPSSRRSGASW